MKKYRKFATIEAEQMTRSFIVKTSEGIIARGKSGDYLVTGVKGKQYICANNIFEESYEKYKRL